MFTTQIFDGFAWVVGAPRLPNPMRATAKAAAPKINFFKAYSS